MYWLNLAVLVIIVVSSLKKDNLDFGYKKSIPFRGILAVLVVLNHSYPEAYMLGNIAVGLFFCFSGYGLVINYQTKQEYLQKSFFINLFKKIIVPYILINSMYIMWNVIVVKKGYSFFQVVMSFFDATIMPVGWYVIMITVLYTLFYIVYGILRPDKTKAKIILIGIGIVITCITLYILNYGSWWYCSLLAFLFGIILAEYPSSIDLLKKRFSVMFIGIVFLLSYVFAKTFQLQDGGVFLGIKILQSLAIGGLYFGIAGTYKINSKVLYALGTHSFIIYMLHPLIARILGRMNLPEAVMAFSVAIEICISLLFSIIYREVTRNDSIKKRL